MIQQYLQLCASADVSGNIQRSVDGSVPIQARAQRQDKASFESEQRRRCRRSARLCPARLEGASVQIFGAGRALSRESSETSSFEGRHMTERFEELEVSRARFSCCNGEHEKFWLVLLGVTVKLNVSLRFLFFSGLS
ncbi:hypothetical protein Q8A67_022093 [Cirrhinus molitorella]|uniref:Uncharacterized protein n=1 Tax=Cirrhinus molitorella TaxID=172907 RepID=A0AA88P155_9TELE|nr:hypothetical protein Q8A67_022093 [Cirrhinus molitorella]